MSEGASPPWRAPREAGGVLCAPALARWQTDAEANAAALHAASDRDLGGRSLGQLRQQARSEIVEAARRYAADYGAPFEEPADSARWFVSGHQPQLFHPGVWFKNFAIASAARAFGGWALNLVIDNDVVRTAAIRVPSGPVERPSAVLESFDQPAPGVAWEEREILDWACLESFPERVAARMRGLVEQPLVREIWPTVVERARATNRLGLALAQGRHLWEAGWGVQTAELPQSALCGLNAYAWAMAHLLLELPRFSEIHNRLLSDYRRRNHVRSPRHPVPMLAREADRYEAPLWIWNAEERARHRLFARRRGTALVLDNAAGWTVELPAASTGALADALFDVAARGTKLRTRALTTTLWARLLSADLFVHGIGGAKYDELTDGLFHDFYEIAPPTFAVATATFPLPLAQREPAAPRADEITEQLRALRYHPEQYLRQIADPAGRAAGEKIAEKKAHWVGRPRGGTDRAERHRAIVEANTEMAALVEDFRSELDRQLRAANAREAAAAILASREYAFCLYPEKELRNFMLEIARIAA